MEKQFCKVGNTKSVIIMANNNYQTRTNKMNRAMIRGIKMAVYFEAAAHPENRAERIIHLS